jgi:hypothetical protein
MNQLRKEIALGERASRIAWRGASLQKRDSRGTVSLSARRAIVSPHGDAMCINPKRIYFYVYKHPPADDASLCRFLRHGICFLSTQGSAHFVRNNLLMRSSI